MKISDELSAVRTCISSVLNGGQGYMLDGIQYNRANLNTLYIRERELLRRLARATGRTTVKPLDISGLE